MATTVSRVSWQSNDTGKQKRVQTNFSTSRDVPLTQQRKLLSIFIKIRISSLIQAILPLSIEAAPVQLSVQLFVAVCMGNGYSNRGVNKRVEGRTETQKNGSKYEAEVRIGNYFANPSRPTTPDSYPVAIYLSNLQSSFIPKTHK